MALGDPIPPESHALAGKLAFTWVKTHVKANHVLSAPKPKVLKKKRGRGRPPASAVADAQEEEEEEVNEEEEIPIPMPSSPNTPPQSEPLLVHLHMTEQNTAAIRTSPADQHTTDSSLIPTDSTHITPASIQPQQALPELQNVQAQHNPAAQAATSVSILPEANCNVPRTPIQTPPIPTVTTPQPPPVSPISSPASPQPVVQTVIVPSHTVPHESVQQYNQQCSTLSPSVPSRGIPATPTHSGSTIFEKPATSVFYQLIMLSLILV